MEKQEIFEHLKNKLVTLFEIAPEKICLEARLFEDLDLDSIDAVDMLVELQKVTGRRLSSQSFKDVRTLGDVVDAIYKTSPVA